MLREIVCDKFVAKPRIHFSDGLNVIQGFDSGTNSIGKSTFLLAIDFVFGGDDYAKQRTIQQRVKAHDVMFRFEFGGIPYFFKRNTYTPSIVEVCDENYAPTGKDFKIDEFRQHLFELYQIPLTDISFRDIVGRYFRIYEKNNLDERSPLAVVPNESKEKSLTALLKLYDRYAAVSGAHVEYETAKAHKNAMRGALKFDIVKKISKRTYAENLERLAELQAELEILASRGRDELLDLDPDQAEKAAELKARQEILSKQKNRLWAQYYATKNAAETRRKATADDFEELMKYFPNTDLRRLSEIEAFHARLSTILKEEFSESMSSILFLVNETSREIGIVEAAIQEINLPQRVSEKTLKSCMSIGVERKTLEDQNKNYDTTRGLEADEKLKRATYEELFKQQVEALQIFINIQIEKLNTEIYGDVYKSPVLDILSTSSYSFGTPGDDGAGINDKNLILLDLAALELTPLPALVHDSDIFKRIDAVFIPKILELYARTKRQCFVAFDRTTTYSESAQTIIDSHTVLQLSEGNELFGVAWNKKQST